MLGSLRGSAPQRNGNGAGFGWAKLPAGKASPALPRVAYDAAVLERIAVHQTRLRVPGVGLDARGVALGSRGLVLLPSLDRLIAFLAVYTEQQTLGGLAESLRIEIVRSKLGTREVALSFDAGGSDRMDRIGEVARLTGGFTFTGTSRHFVQYRDAGAPFGYDATEITATDQPLALYHTTFSQVYDVERTVELESLLLRLMPHADPGAELGSEPVWILAESGLGPSVLSYFARSNVDAEVGVAEWPPETSFDDQPVRRFLFRVEQLPPRMRPLLKGTPGLTAFVPVTPGAAVEHGYHHPIALEACPVFDAEGLVMFRGRGEPALRLGQLPVLADIRSLQRADVVADEAALTGKNEASPTVRIPVRLLPDPASPSSVTAVLVPPDELQLLRRLAYALSTETIRDTRIAITNAGAFVMGTAGVATVPLGFLYWSLHSRVLVPCGARLVPAVGAEVLFEALGAPGDRIIFFRTDGSAVAVPDKAFEPLESALLEAQKWAPIQVTELEEVFETDLPTVWLDELGLSALRGVNG